MGVERIGKYRVLARLGQGGMAKVLLTMAEGPHGFHKLLVVKELREELAHDPDFLAMFLDEARIAARLNHPNIVQTYETGNDGERYFIAMEYLEGQPLNAIYRRIGRPKIPLEINLRILADVLAALDHAHNLADYDGTPLHVVHRDVSPQNVFLTYDGQVKLVDFGIAKMAGSSSRTQEGVLKGKISYISPEQARCDAVDGRADLFTVGLMLWESIAGRRLVQREDEASVLSRRMSGQDPPIASVVPDVPGLLATICDTAMAPDPADRFQTASEFREALEHYLAFSDVRVGPPALGRLVTDAFVEERAHIRKAIEEQVKNVDRGQGPISLELRAQNLSQTSDSLPRVLPPSPSDSPPASNTQLVHAMPRPTRSRSVLPALGVGAMLAGGALLGVAYLGREPAGPAPDASPGSARSGDAPGETTRITLRYPEGAKASLDGSDLHENPFVARVDRDGKPHLLIVERDGFESVRRTITYDRDVDLAIELAPVVPASAAPLSTSPSTAPRPGGRGARPPSPAEAATATPQATGDEPSSRKPPQPSVDIDEHNPYKKKP